MPRKADHKRGTHSASFLRSLSIDRDFGSVDITERYILTSNALRATRRVLDAIEKGVGGAWTLVGPFGTGKSAFCLYLAHLLGAARDDSTPLAGTPSRRVKPVTAFVVASASGTTRKRPCLCTRANDPATALQQASLWGSGDQEHRLPTSRRLWSQWSGAVSRQWKCSPAT